MTKDEAQSQSQQEVQEWMKPHPKCDSACLFQCTKGFTQFPECAAQSQQEPVAYRSRLESGSYTYCNTAQFFDNAEPLYTSPPARKPLTDEEFLELILRIGTQELVGVATFVGGSIQMRGKIGLLRSAKVIKEFVEAAHGIKEDRNEA